MSTALYRRYRPESFADVIGQEHVTEPLMTALEKNRVNHAYLFSGPRGCGKTTSARILARCLNCVNGPTPNPCGECESCRDLSRDGGGSLDVIEMDAASHGGVDHARDLRERASFAPVRDRYKIFIIDEAHMVTREGFNALLKIVEEPPAHIKFIFATTEPNKVLGTIRSRTHHYPFRLVPPETLHDYLAKLCQEENVQVAPGVLQLVVRAGGGSVRDSLSILDQLMAGAGSDGITYDLAVALLGFTHGELLDGVVDALAASNASAVFEAVNTAIQSGQDPRRFVEDLLERFRDLLMLQAVPDASQSVLRGMPEAQLRSMRAQAERLTTADVTRAAELTSDALNEMSGAINPQLTLELMCARIMLATSENSQALGARLDRIEKRLDDGDFAAPARSRADRPTAASGSGEKTEAKAPATTPNSVPTQQGSASAQPQATQAPTSQAPASQAPAPLQSAPLAGLRRPAQSGSAQGQQTPSPQSSVQHPANQNAPSSQPAQNQSAPNQPAQAQAPQQNQPRPTQNQPVQNQAGTNLVEMAKTNWHDIVARVSSPTARSWFEQCTPSKYEDGQLFIRATMDVLKMVKPHIEELAHAVYQVLEAQVRIRAEVDKSGKPAQAPAQQTPPFAGNMPAPTGQRDAQNQPEQRQPAQNQNAPQQSRPQPVAEGPRGGEEAWAQHGQPRTEAAPQWSTDDWNNPVTSWDVAPIPSGDGSEDVAQQAEPQSAPPQSDGSQAPGSESQDTAPSAPLETADTSAQEDTYADAHPAAQVEADSSEAPSEEPAEHSLSEQVDGEVEHLTPNTDAEDSQDARGDGSDSETQEVQGDSVPFEQAQHAEQAPESSSEQGSLNNAAQSNYYDGPTDEPYEDREYIAGVGYADDAPGQVPATEQAAPAQQAASVQQTNAISSVPPLAQPSQTPATQNRQGVGRPPLAPAGVEGESPATPSSSVPTNPAQQAQPAPTEVAREMAEPGRKLSFRERHAAQIAAGAQSAYAQQHPEAVNDEPEEFVPSDDDTALEETVLIGQRAVEKVLGGIVIDEQPLHG